MITYQSESWEEYFRDCQELWKEEYEEIVEEKDKLPMLVDAEKYLIGEKSNSLQIITVRDDTKIIGHVVAWIYYEPHHCTILYGCTSTFYLSKKYRSSLIGRTLVKKTEEFLKQRGVQKLFFMCSPSPSMDRFFKSLSFKKTYATYEKWIENGC